MSKQLNFKLCKYNCNTDIGWDTQLNAFVERDGRHHDRNRCESLRPATATSSTSTQQATSYPSQQQQQQQQAQQSRYETNYLIPKDDWDKVLSNIQTITAQLNRLSEYYGDLLEHVRATTTRNQKMADAEARYDQDKEDGLV